MIYVGCMTGTSADRYADFTAATFNQQGLPDSIRNMAISLPADLQHALQQISHLRTNPQQRQHIEDQFTDFLIDAHRTIIHTLSLKGHILLSPHGQTIDHQPLANPPYCDVLINAEKLANTLGYPVITAHRQACLPVSMAAPLAPVLIRKLFAHPNKPTVLLNGGGIANICLLQQNKPIIGYDTGPANAPLDILVQYLLEHHPEAIPTDLFADIHTHRYDPNGTWASRGKIIPRLQQQLLQHEYFHRPMSQKSADKATFGLNWFLPFIQKEDAWGDALATLTDVIAQTITDALVMQEPFRLIAYGGIVHNSYLMKRIQDTCPQAEWIDMRYLGYDPDFFESLLMAYLGYCVDTQTEIDLGYCARDGIAHAYAIPGHKIIPSCASL